MELLEQYKLKWDIKIQPWSFATLTLYSDDIEELAMHLQKKLAQAPHFFKNTPIILAFDENLDALEINTLQNIFNILTRYQLHLSACSGPEHWGRSIAEFFNIPYLPNKNTEEIQIKEHSKTLLEPLRAGQQIYAEGDVIVLSKTHSGSEIITQGNIHCYAKAQGRLLAGVNGDIHARIFCQYLETELVSIAGVFMTKRQISQEFLGRRCMISLQNDKILIQCLDKEAF